MSNSIASTYLIPNRETRYAKGGKGGNSGYSKSYDKESYDWGDKEDYDWGEKEDYNWGEKDDQDWSGDKGEMWSEKEDEEWVNPGTEAHLWDADSYGEKTEEWDKDEKDGDKEYDKSEGASKEWSENKYEDEGAMDGGSFFGRLSGKEEDGLNSAHVILIGGLVIIVLLGVIAFIAYTYKQQ